MASENPVEDWDDATTEEWLQAVDRVVERFAQENDIAYGQEWELVFNCPRCEDRITKSYKVVPGVLEVQRTNRVYIECNCTVAHPKRPEDIDRGCGHHGTFLAPWARGKAT